MEIEPLGHAKAEWFATFLDLPHGIPSRTWHATFGRVFAHRDAAHFEACCAAWMRAAGLPPAGGERAGRQDAAPLA